MTLSQLKLVFGIMYKTKSPKIFLSIFTIIILVLSLSIGAYFFTGNLLNSYSNMLQKSYLGFEPRFTMQSDNQEFLHEVATILEQKNILSSLRKIEKKTYILKLNNRTLKKKITFYIYKDGYINHRFKGDTGVYVNQILKHILKDETEINMQKGKYKQLHLQRYKTVDTGFLTSEALIFIDESKIKKFIKTDNLQLVLEVQEQLQKETLQEISKSAKRLQVLKSNFIDRLQSEHDAYENFLLFKMAKNIFLTILITTIIIIILITQNIILELKEKSLHIILQMGMGLNEVVVVFLLISSSIFISSTAFAHLILSLFRNYYLQVTHFSSDFFIPLVFGDYLILIYSMFILLFLTIIMNIIILRGTLK